MAFARDVADRVLFMDQGQIVEGGSAAEVMANPRNPRTRAFLARYHRDAAATHGIRALSADRTGRHSSRSVRYFATRSGSTVTPSPGPAGTWTRPSRTGNGSVRMSSQA